VQGGPWTTTVYDKHSLTLSGCARISRAGLPKANRCHPLVAERDRNDLACRFYVDTYEVKSQGGITTPAHTPYNVHPKKTRRRVLELVVDDVRRPGGVDIGFVGSSTSRAFPGRWWRTSFSDVATSFDCIRLQQSDRQHDPFARPRGRGGTSVRGTYANQLGDAVDPTTSFSGMDASGRSFRSTRHQNDVAGRRRRRAVRVGRPRSYARTYLLALGAWANGSCWRSD